MKKKVLPILTRVALVLMCWFYGANAFAQGGHGAPNNPYRIRKANELVAFAQCLATGNQFYFYKYGYSKEYICSTTPPTYGDYDTIPAYGEGKYFLIPNDITLNQGNLAACDGKIDPSWTVWPETVVFKGHLLGDMHTISGMYIDCPDTTVGVGFFSKMEGDAHVEKLGIVNSYVRGGASNIGGMVGELSGGHINDCFFEGSIRTSGDNVGGLVGLMTLHDTLLPEVSVCFASGHLDCTGDYVAGLVGKVEKGIVRHCYSSMAVRTTDMVGIALSGENPTKGGIGTDEYVVNHHVGGIYGYAISPNGTNSYDPDVDSIRVDTCYFDWQLSDLPSIPGSSWVPTDWRDNRGAAALSTYDMTYYSMMYFDIKNQKPSLWKNTYLCNMYSYPDPFNDPINVTYRLELDYPQDSNVISALIPFLDVFMKPNGNGGQSTIDNMNDQERKHMKLSDLTASFVLWKLCDSLEATWTLDNLWPDAVRREFYAPDNSWNVYLQKQGVVRLTIEVAGRTRYYDAVVNIPPYVGSAENPFLISNLEDFLAFRDGINANKDFVYHRFLIPHDSLSHIHWIQTADIDLASVGDWTPIGKNADTCFTGFYDGRGHKLMNLTMTNGTDRALFIYSKGDIKNLVIEDPNITGCSGSSAALATNVMGGSFENCAVTYSAGSNNHSPLQFVGNQCAALIGSVEMGNAPHTSIHITGCFNSCDIVNNWNGGYAAGLVGYVNADTCRIERCFNAGDITADNGTVHPLVGHCRNTTRRVFKNCYNAGVLTGTQVEVESANTTFYNDYHVNPVCEGATKVATRYFIGPETLVREYMGDDDWLYEEGRYPRLRWTDSSSVRTAAIAACTPRTAIDHLPLPDTMTVDNFHDLNNLRNIVNGNSMVIYKDYLLPHYVQDIVFSLTNDVNLSDITSNWIPIGTKRFAGTFLGNNHTLNQLSSTRSVVGLFGTLAGKVYDLNITVNTITGADTAGAVCAILNGGRIENCSVKKYNNTSDNLYGVTVGGIAGVSLTASDSIVGCFNYVDVIGTYCVGGLIAEGGNVRNSANAGDVTGKAECVYIGGLSGRNTNVISSLNTGIVTAQPGNTLADNYVGGLVGKVENGEWKVENSYNAGIVNGENRKYVGGLCGVGAPQYCYVSNTVCSTGEHLGSIAGQGNGTILKCCYDNQMSPAGGIDGSDQAGTAEGMPTANTMGTGDNDFYNTFWGENASTNIWYYSDNYYPQLQGIRNLNTTFSNASAMRAQLYDQETYNTVSHQFTLNYADVGSWQRVGGSNCVSIGTTPSNNLITVTIPSTNNHPAQGYITLGFRGPGTNDPVYRKVQLWVNLSEANPIIIKDSLQLTRFRTIINQGSGYYNSATQTFFTSGSYTASQYVRITDGGRNLYFKLTANVDLAFHGTTSSGQPYNVLDLWTSIGTKTRPFRGHFDGGNHTVISFLVPGSDNQGFFGYIYGGTVKNLSIAGAITNHNTTGDHRGILCGYNNSGTIRNCFITQDVGSNYHSPSRLSAVTGRNLGFICGTNHYGRIVRCQTDMTQIENATYTHGSSFGGICGYNDFGTIDSCRSHMAIVNGITIDTVGGIVGYNHNGILRADTSYNNSYNKSIMSYVGCIAGYSDGEQSEIRSCYVDEQSRVPSIGDYIGGVVGKMQDGVIDSCGHYGTIIAQGNFVGGIVGMMSDESEVKNCLNAGIVCESMTGDCVGGIVGTLTNSSSISTSFNSGIVTGRNHVGGIVGKVESGQWKVEDCYNTGIVKGIAQVGGMVGFLDFTQGGSFAYGYSAGWVEASSMAGAVCGFTTDASMLHDLHYDSQMCSYKGINEEDVTGVTAHTTSGMMAVTFSGRPWEAGTADMYPRLTVFSGTDISKVSALALQIGDVYNLSYNPNTSYTLPSYTPVSGTFRWSKVKSSDNTASLSGTTLTPSGMRNFMRIKATRSIVYNYENHTIPLRYVQLSFGISEQHPLTVNIVGFRQLSDYINNGQPFYYANGAFYSSNQTLTNATPIPAGADGIYFSLAENGNYTGNGWIPIGTEEHPFRGYLDGAGYSVQLRSTQISQDNWGLFGYMQGRLSNIIVDSFNITVSNHVGALVGYCHGTVKGCSTRGAGSVKGTNAVGGLIGEAYYSQVLDCYNGFDVKGTQSVGGLVGLVSADGTIARSFNYGLVKATGEDSRVGGLVGSIQNSTFKIHNSYNTGAVKGNTNVGPFVGLILNSEFGFLNCYNAGYIDGTTQAITQSNNQAIFNDRQLYPQELSVFTSHLYTSEMLSEGLRSQLGDTYWSYHDDEYPRLKNFENTAASTVSVKPLDLGDRMQADNIVKNFSGETSDGVKWYRHGTGTALNTPNPATANGLFTLNTCGVDSLKVTLTSDTRVERRVVPVVVTGAGITIDTVRACAAYTWEPANGYSVTLDKPGVHTYLAEGAACENTKAIDLYFANPIEVSIVKQDACMDSYWSKYGHNIGYLKATVEGGGFGAGYAYEWSRANGTIDNESFIAERPDSLRYLDPDIYYLTTTDVTPHSVCERRDTVLVDEYSFNYLVTKWGNCVDQPDGWIELVIRQFEFNRDGSPYSIMYWDSNHRFIAEHTIPALNPPDESGVPKGYDTLFNLDNGLYYMTITDRLGCYQDKQIKVNDPINPKMTLRAKGFKKVYDGLPVTMNSINVVEYDDNWKVPERAEYYVTSDQWRQLALRIGDSLIVSLAEPDRTVTDVDSVRNRVVHWEIKDAETGKDKTCLYHFYPVDSCIVILPATLTLFTGSATKEYDGTPLTSNNWNVQGLEHGEHVWCDHTSGSQTEVGSSPNTCEIDWGNPGPWGENIAKQGNYTVINHFGTLTVTPNTSEIVLTAGSASRPYDGTALTSGTVTWTGLPTGFSVEATTSGSQTNTGTSANVVESYVIKNADGVDKTENFTNVTTVAGTLTVEPADLFITTPSATKSYNGTALTAAFDPSTGAGNISGLAEGETIAVTTTGSQTEVGNSANSYTIDWGTTSSNNYEIHANLGTLTVTRGQATVTADNIAKVYGGTDPVLTATVTGVADGNVVTYTLSRAAGETTGTYTITPVGAAEQGNYTVTYETGTFTITRATATVTADHKEKVAGQEDPALTATVSGLQNGDEVSVVSYTLSRAAGEAEGDYTITPSGEVEQGNYDVTYVPGTLTITPATQVVVRIAGRGNTTVYDGVAHAVSGYDVVSISNPDYSEEDFTFTGTAAASRTDAGTTYMGLAANQFENTVGGFNVTFIVTDGYQTITPAPATVAAEAGTKTYGDSDPTLMATVTGAVGSETLNYTLARAVGEAAGTYLITVTLGENPNYSVTKTDAIFTINRKAATVTADNLSKVYGNSDPTLTATVTGTVGSDVIAYTLSRAAGNAVGTYAVTVNLGSNPNYEVTANGGTFTINKRPATVTANNASKTYGGDDPELTATVEGTVGSDAIDYTLSRAEGENAGSYAVTVTPGANPNYEVTAMGGTFTINKRTATVTANSASKVYGDADPELTAMVGGLQNGDTATDINYTLSRAEGEDIGSYAVTVTPGSNANYELSVVGSQFTITKRPITVTADTLTKIYGDADPTLTATVTGLGEGMSPSAINYTVSREAGEDAGTYPVTVTPGSNPNYEVTAIGGSFGIAKRLVVMVPTTQSKVYGDEDPTLTATLSDTVAGERVNYTLSRAGGEAVGMYAITVTPGVNQNYELVAQSGYFFITKREVTVAADNQSKVYGTADPALTATVSGIAGSDVLNYTLSRAAGEAAGSYAVTVTLGSNPNYEVSATGGTFTIVKRDATVTADPKSKTYGTGDPTLTATVTGLVGSDVLNYTLTRTAGEDVGTYAISVNVNENDNPNYQLTTSGSQFTITRALAMVVADSVTKVYGEVDPLLTTSVGGLRNGDDQNVISYNISRETGEDAGTYAITLVGDAVQGNYNVIYLPATFTITRASATVTADDKDKVVGDADPTLTATVTGLVGSDMLSYTLTRAEGEDIGTYTITATGEPVQGNYNVSYVPGTFRITNTNEAIVRINGHHNTTVYDGAEHTVSGYDIVSISNPGYSESDFNFNGTAVASRTDVGTTYMELDGKFLNNNSSFIVTFIVNDGYQTVAPHSLQLAVGANTWHAISSPVSDGGQNYLSVSNVNGMTNVDYDLYRYNEETATWENYKTHGFNLERGRGYIYRRAASTTLTFSGQPNSGNVDYALTYGCSDAAMKGFNLVGNPYPHPDVIGENCFSLNEDGTWRAQLANYQVPVAHAVLVHTNEARTLTFSEDSKKGIKETPPVLVFRLADTTYEDIAYVQFAGMSQGEPLPKVAHMNVEAPMLSILGNAIAILDDSCESFPLEMQAAPGVYTLTVSGQSEISSYCHLIDLHAQRDINLLRNNSYTFTATGNDAGRFLVKLVPDIQDAQPDIFAYQDGNELMVTGEGALEVYDVLGRRLFRENVSTYQPINVSVFPGTGVYILRLNGQSQKIVIK